MSACQKEDYASESLSQKSSQSIQADDQFTNLNLDGCLDEIESEYVNLNERVFTSAFFEYLNSLNTNHVSVGTPKFDAAITVQDEVMNSTQTILPFVDEQAEEVKSVLIYDETTTGELGYAFLSKQAILDNPDLSIELVGQEIQEGESSVLTGEDFLEMFGALQCYIYCGELEDRGPDPRCFRWRTPWWKKFGRWIRRIFTGNGNGNNSGNPDDFEIIIWVTGGGGGDWTSNGRPDPPSNSGGGNGGTLHPPHYTNLIRLQMCEGYLDVYDTGPDNPNSQHPDIEFCTGWMEYKDACLGNTGMTFDQLTELWAQLQFHHPQTFNYILNNDSGCNGQALAELLVDQTDLHLNDNEVQEFLAEPSLIEPIKQFLNGDNGLAIKIRIVHDLLDLPRHTLTPELINKVHAFWDEHYSPVNGEDLEEAIEAFLKLKGEDNAYNFDRFEELYEFLETDPQALMNGCLTAQTGSDPILLEDYADLYNFDLPQSSLNHLDQLGDEFFYQEFYNATSRISNLDYFGVEINQMPDINGDGIPDSQNDVYEAIRTGFSGLSDGSDYLQSNCGMSANVSWEFLPYSNPSDLNKWNSTDPLNTMFYIEAGSSNAALDLAADDGAVLVTQYSECCWIFTTINTPQSGSQPFSGHRQFGIKVNDNANFEFYTRAVDRVKLPVLLHSVSAGFMNNCGDDDYFEIADMTWRDLQQQVKDFINQNGGNATVEPQQNIRINYVELRDKLKSNVPVNFVSCD